jgi:hypothetical protein
VIEIAAQPFGFHDFSRTFLFCTMVKVYTITLLSAGNIMRVLRKKQLQNMVIEYK